MGRKQVLALCGGVGGAKLALGLNAIATDFDLTIVVNTGDDFQHLGLPISPDLDTVMYTLAGINHQQQGWGLAGESWQAMDMFKCYGAESWFQLGDRDLATHILRRQMLSQGATLSEVTAQLCQSLGVKANVLPMSDDAVSTVVDTDDGPLPFQNYFVQKRCQPRVTGLNYVGAQSARPQPEFMALLRRPELEVIIICPSNPFLSVQPMLAIPGVKEALVQSDAPVIAVSPIVAGQAIKGPTAKMMEELRMSASAHAIAEYYLDIIDGFVLDDADSSLLPTVSAFGVEVALAATVMHNNADKANLAGSVMDFAQRLIRVEQL